MPSMASLRSVLRVGMSSANADAHMLAIAVQANVWTGQSSSTPVKTYDAVGATEMMLSLWGILTFCFFCQTLRINRGLQTLFISLAVLFFLLAGGVRNELCNKVKPHPCC